MRGLAIRLRRRLRPDAPATCAEVARVLQPYLDGEVDEVTTRRVARHLEDCLRCGLEAETYRALKLALRQHGPLRADSLARLRAFAEHLADTGDPDAG